MFWAFLLPLVLGNVFFFFFSTCLSPYSCLNKRSVVNCFWHWGIILRPAISPVGFNILLNVSNPRSVTPFGGMGMILLYIHNNNFQLLFYFSLSLKEDLK